VISLGSCFLSRSINTVPVESQLYGVRMQRAGLELTSNIPRGAKNEDVVTHIG
jgi:hypothetical protein